jgi:ABC-type cobalamin/Fe3+-siderophores transport system ATPase subunit
MSLPAGETAPGFATIRFRLSESIAFLRVGDRHVFFSEDLQKLFEKDEISTYLSCRLMDATTPDALARDLVDRGLRPAAALSRIRQALRFWSDLGALRTDSLASGGRVASSTIALAGRAIGLACADDEAARLLAPVFAHLASPGQPALRMEATTLGGDICLADDTGRAMVVPRTLAAPTLKASMTERILASLEDEVALHVAMLVRDGRATLLCGPPGAGKSTLAMALTQHGFALAGDDIALQGADGLLLALGFAPTLKQGAWRLVDPFRDPALGTPRHLRPDGKQVRFVRPLSYAPPKPYPAHRLLILRRGRRKATRLVPVDASEALSHILEGAFTPSGGLSRAQLARAIALVEASRPAALHYSALEEAARAASEHHG